ncbi:amidoligase family protein [Neptuniibacter sp. CAU 1671]|uniref:amidoligase family protein n=1 Tax=Neptuniibacter sp. CAU 1671 TaxID=3032593 RepID=UPI0023DB5B8C|nr:amidoligase family protein [Neptuniibacter sp. CAU 1671]MDF2181151.1 amidoligase family protein [Neptuniibacter sp. CAU 1671]
MTQSEEQADINWLPQRQHTENGSERRVGVEIEMTGLGPEQICQAIASHLGGRVTEQTPLEWFVRDTQLGDFKVELDASYLKALAEQELLKPEDSLGDVAMSLLTSAAEQVVPWELVTPPLPLSRLKSLHPLIADFRKLGAKGTRDAIHYAFGVHLNPELPALDAATITAYLKAYLCLYDWIVACDKTDLSRRLTTYIKHFDKRYIALVIDPDYRPDQTTLIDDYLRFNPSRNRSLDMLPLFAYLDEDRVRQTVDDPRINARPTLHYRLPNCDIDNPLWNIDNAWQHWLVVESLAQNPQRLLQWSQEYQQELSRLTHTFESRWLLRTEQLLEDEQTNGRV